MARPKKVIVGVAVLAWLLTAAGAFSGSEPRQSLLRLEWEWDWQNAVEPLSNQVMSAPAVADLNLDGIPDIVFPTATAPYFQPWVLRAISGDDGSPLFDVISSYIGVHGSPAIGDIDNDGLPEIVIPGQTSGRIVAFENSGVLKWVSPDMFNQWGPTVCIANLDNQDLPEIIYGSIVLNASDGSIRWQGGYGRGYNSVQGPISCVADLDLQSPPEVVAGNTAYRYNGQVYWQKADPGGPNFVPPQISDGFASVANFDADPYPEIVLVTEGDVYLLEHNGEVKWSYPSFPGGGLVGAPTIEDFDGDGEPEIGLAGRNQYAVFETNGSLKWTQTIRDYSSGTCCSSVFDFDGDGSMEVAYADEVRLWVFRASDGEVLDSVENSSCTTAEFPVVVDVDGDGQVEIVVCANDYGGWGVNKGIRVFGAEQGNWVAARKIWNQHTYHITNVNDDATIPIVELNNWETYNNFRCQMRDVTGVRARATNATPVRFGLCQSYPNPFSRSCVVRYQLPVEGKVSLKVYDATGRLVRILLDEGKSVGCHGISWDGRNDFDEEVGSGVYFYSIQTDEFAVAKKMMLLK